MKVLDQLKECQDIQINFLTKKVEMIKCFLGNGFVLLYSELVEKGQNPKKAFDFCNNQYAVFCGNPKYKTFEAFLSANFSSKDSDKKHRDYLLSYFKENGFDSWESFSPLILCYYPQVTAEKLLLFYEGKQLDKEVLKHVDFVRQIIG